MKRIILIITLTIIAVAASAANGGSRAKTFNLDSALEAFASYLGGRLTTPALAVVAVTETPAQRLGNHIADELTSLLLNNTRLRMISRRDFERVLAEQNVQAGLNFNDDTTAKIGHNLGWNVIIYAGVEPLRESYRLSLRAVNVETGELHGAQSYMLNGGDPVLISLVNPNINVQRLSDREALLQPFSGKRNHFQLTVSTSKTVYYDNEELFITLRASADCYFVVYHLDIDNNMQVIYPNFWEKDKNVLKANVERVIPEDASFALHAPYGEERILVYASPRPFTIPEDQYKPQAVTADYLASPQALWRIENAGEGSKAVSVVPRGATAQASYTILPGK